MLILLDTHVQESYYDYTEYASVAPHAGSYIAQIG